MKVDQPNLRDVRFDCPWQGHETSDMLIVRNPAVPGLVGKLCVRCHCMVYGIVEQSAVVGVDGLPLPTTAKEGTA